MAFSARGAEGLAAWQSKVNTELHTELSRLVTRTPEGLFVQPLYTESVPPALGGGARATFPRGWDHRARVQEPDPAAANQVALDELAHDATSLCVEVDASGAHGVAITDEAGLRRVLSGVDLAGAPVALAGFAHQPGFAAALARLAAEHGAPGHADLGVDPLGALARTGALPIPLGAAQAEGLALLAAVPGGRALAVDSAVWHQGGANEAQDLGILLAGGVAWLRAGEAAGVAPEQVLEGLGLRVALDPTFFFAAAKLRALRLVWARLGELVGAPVRADITARPSERSLGQRDPWVNILRVTAASFGAVIGGADHLVTAAFDDPLGLPDAASRRLARNTQHLLRHEAHLDAVADPAGGSYFVEALTGELAASGWAFFQRIEGEGGLAAAMRSGWLQAEIAASAAARRVEVATRKRPLLGISEFPLLSETRPKARPRPLALRRAEGVERVAAVPTYRFAEPFEALRDRADAAVARPVVYLARLSSLAAHSARVGFVAPVVAAGGFLAAGEGIADTPEAQAEAFVASGAKVACLCGADADYASAGIGLVRALRAAGPASVWVAGRPGQAEAAWREAGVTGFLYMGCDVLAVLEAWWAEVSA